MNNKMYVSYDLNYFCYSIVKEICLNKQIVETVEFGFKTKQEAEERLNILLNRNFRLKDLI